MGKKDKGKKIIIDINTFSYVFNRSNSNHNDFKEVRNCIINKKHFLVIGGKKFFEEIKKNVDYVNLINQLKIQRKIKVYDSQQVDRLEKKITSGKSNDKHILSLLVISETEILCTKDKNLQDDAKNIKKVYDVLGKNYSKKVKIYSGKKNTNLLK